MIKKRSYKNFIIEDFLSDIYQSDIDTRVTALNDLELAASEFQSLFSEILNRHAPVKTFQMRKNYLPYLSQNTKSLIKEINILFKKATMEGNREKHSKSKEMSKQIKKEIKRERK